MKTLYTFLFILLSGSYLVSSSGQVYVAGWQTEQYCNTDFGYCLLYPDTFTSIIDEMEEKRDGVTFLCSDQMEFSVFGYYNVMNLSFADMYRSTQQELLDNYDQVNEISSVVYGTNFYEMEVAVGNRKVYEKTFDFNGKIVTLRASAPLEFSDEIWNLLKVKTTISLNV